MVRRRPAMHVASLILERRAVCQHVQHELGDVGLRQAMRDVAERAVAVNGYALKYVPQELQKDAELVKTAVAQNGYALRFAFGDHVAGIRRKAEEEEGHDDDGQPNLKKDEDVVAAATEKRVQSVATEVETVEEPAVELVAVEPTPVSQEPGAATDLEEAN